jgi:hypothetical protein
MRVNGIMDVPCLLGHERNGRRSSARFEGEAPVNGPLFRAQEIDVPRASNQQGGGNKKKGKKGKEVVNELAPLSRHPTFSIIIEKQERRLDVCSGCGRSIGCFLIIERVCGEDSCGHNKCPFVSGRMDLGEVEEKGVCRQCKEKGEGNAEKRSER